jgi:hypothetical protein
MLAWRADASAPRSARRPHPPPRGVRGRGPLRRRLRRLPEGRPHRSVRARRAGARAGARGHPERHRPVRARVPGPARHRDPRARRRARAAAARRPRRRPRRPLPPPARAAPAGRPRPRPAGRRPTRPARRRPRPAPRSPPTRRRTTRSPTRPRRDDDGGGGVPAALVALLVLAALFALCALVWALFRFFAWEPRWLLGARHATAEAGWRASGAWADFTDWLRSRRSTA